MFAPKVAKPQTKPAASSTNSTHERSMSVAHRPGHSLVEQTLFLQRSIGNQAVLRLMAQRGSSPTGEEASADDARGASWDFSKIPLFPPDRANRPQVPSSITAPPLSGAIQAKLKVGSVDDPLEYEADRIADQVMRMPANAALDHGANATLVQIQKPSQRGGGKPLAEPEKAFFESRLRCDFSNVRVYSDAKAAESARAINAVAYTVGQDIVFDAGRYAPQTPKGRLLLAHELAHVVQQSTASRAEVIRRQPAPPPSSSASAAAVAPSFAQADYDAAVALIGSRNARLVSFLSQGRVGSTVRVRTEHLPVQGGGPGSVSGIDFFFDLQIVAGAVPGARAAFQDIDVSPVMTAPTATLTQPLPIFVNAALPGTTNPANGLAEQLFHEGLHMLLKMDRVMELFAPGATNQQTGTLASFNTYKTRAKAGSNFLPLQVDLSTVIGAYFTTHPGTLGAPNRIADHVIDRFIEERFAVDQQRQQFTGSIVASATNNAIARGYLRRYLADEGVSLAVSDPNVMRLFGEVTAMLDDIPTNLGAPSPAATGSGNLPPPAGPVPPSPQASPPPTGSSMPKQGP